MRHDVDAIRRAVDWAAYYRSELGDPKRISNGESYFICSFHNDHEPSFRVEVSSGKWYCDPCGFGGDGFRFFQERHGVGFREALEHFARLTGAGQNGNGRQSHASSRGNPPEKRVVTRYVYTDLDGKPLFRVCRTKPKWFFQERYESGKWLTGLGDVKPVLYNLPAILKAKDEVYVVEGEKDADRLNLKGFIATTCPMGAGKWRDEYNPIFEGKTVYILPDNDPPGDKHGQEVARSVFPFAKEVKIIRLPGLLEKGDVSDWLDQGNTKEQLLELIRNTPAVMTEELKPEQTPEGSTKIKSIPAELENRWIHPANHIEPGFSSVGIVTRVGRGLDFQIITSGGNVYSEKDLKGVLSVEPMVRSAFLGRYFLPQNPKSPFYCFDLLRLKIQELVSFEDDRWYSLLSLWVMGTYLFPAFPTFPYLHITGPKGSGKTKLLDIFEVVTFNGHKMLDPTSAVIFRTVQAFRPTLLVDEVEGMSHDEFKEIRGIINAGYKKGGTVSRCEGPNYQLKEYEVYSPKVLAGIKGLGDVLEDRCISLVMLRPPLGDSRQNQPVKLEDPAWGLIREGFINLTLKYSGKLLELLKDQNSLEKLIPDWLNARDRELWFSLVLLADQVDKWELKEFATSDRRVLEKTLGLAQESVKDRGLDFDTEIYLDILEDRLDGEMEILLHPKDLVGVLENEQGKKISPKFIGLKLGKKGLGFEQAGKDRGGNLYKITAERIRLIRERYGTPRTCSQVHSEQCSQDKLI